MNRAGTPPVFHTAVEGGATIVIQRTRIGCLAPGKERAFPARRNSPGDRQALFAVEAIEGVLESARCYAGGIIQDGPSHAFTSTTTCVSLGMALSSRL